MNFKKINNFFLFAPTLLLLVFGGLILRARNVFGDWPKIYVTDDPSWLRHAAEPDLLGSIFSYSSHINLTYGLLLLSIISIFVVLIWNRASLRLYVLNWILALALLTYEKNRFLEWFFD